MTIRWFACAAVALVLCLGTHPAISAPLSASSGIRTPVGIWLLSNQRIRLEIAPCAEKLCGTLVWFKHPTDAQGLPLVDSRNSDPSLRTRPLLGLTVLRGLRQTGEDQWEDGHLYNPDDGKEYQARMSIAEDGSLHVRAFVVLEMLGETEVMTRVEDQKIAAASPEQD